ncbi:unnamed protein product, partial [Meganyctiphanes norvegica]
MGSMLSAKQCIVEPGVGLVAIFRMSYLRKFPEFRYFGSFQGHLQGVAAAKTYQLGFIPISPLCVLGFIPISPLCVVNIRAKLVNRGRRRRHKCKTFSNAQMASKIVRDVLWPSNLFSWPKDQQKLVYFQINFIFILHIHCSYTSKRSPFVISSPHLDLFAAYRQNLGSVFFKFRICIRHQSLLDLSEIKQGREITGIVTEFVGYGELQQLWRSLGRLPENLVKIYLAQIAIALDFLHNAGIIFRDLKMENILLDADGHIKLIDFGLAQWLSYGGRTTTICGTLQFMGEWEIDVCRDANPYVFGGFCTHFRPNKPTTAIGPFLR